MGLQLTKDEIIASGQLEARHKAIFAGLALFLLIIKEMPFSNSKIGVVPITGFLFIYSFYVWKVSRNGEVTHWYRLWWEGFVLDMGFIGYLVAACGHISSPFVLLYPVAMVGASLSVPGIREFLVAGTIGHISYALGVFGFMGTIDFYGNIEFWAVGGLNGLIFLCITKVVRSMRGHVHKMELMSAEIQLKNEQLQELATTDGLTRLYNHRFFWERLQQELNRSNRNGFPLSLLMIDVDFFKIYNDQNGHLEGDKALKELASIFQENLRNIDIASRYGGEEFTIILPETSQENGLQTGERIRKAVCAHKFSGGDRLPQGKFTVSIGLSCYPADATDALDLVNKADNALYGAKQGSKNKVMSYRSLISKLNDSKESSKDFYRTLETLMAVLNAKDSYTGEHSQRVARSVDVLSEKLGLEQNTRRALVYAAFLHDIGKLEIDRQTLTKPGPLTEIERENIKKHTLFGVSLLEPVLISGEVLPAIKYHHERFDGKGYPDGLQGEEIPLGARILALADSFDAMISERPYREAMDLENVIEEFKVCAGSQFDPKLTAEFLKTVKELKDFEGMEFSLSICEHKRSEGLIDLEVANG